MAICRLYMENGIHSVFLIGIIIVAGNFIYETIVRLLNTIDIVDAVYGLFGVLCSLIYLYYINDHGFENKE